MAKLAGIIIYPTDVPAMLAERRQGKPFRAFIKTKMADENTRFLDTNHDPKNRYRAFIGEKAQPPINVAGDLRKRAEALAKTGDWRNKEWKNAIPERMIHCENMAHGNFKRDFWKSKEAREAREKTVRRR